VAGGLQFDPPAQFFRTADTGRISGSANGSLPSRSGLVNGGTSIIANFIQLINPTSDSELRTVISFLLFSLTYNYIILVGLTVILLKFVYNTVYSKRIERQEKE